MIAESFLLFDTVIRLATQVTRLNMGGSDLVNAVYDFQVKRITGESALGTFRTSTCADECPLLGAKQT